MVFHQNLSGGKAVPLQYEVSVREILVCNQLQHIIVRMHYLNIIYKISILYSWGGGGGSYLGDYREVGVG